MSQKLERGFKEIALSASNGLSLKMKGIDLSKVPDTTLDPDITLDRDIMDMTIE